MASSEMARTIAELEQTSACAVQEGRIKMDKLTLQLKTAWADNGLLIARYAEDDACIKSRVNTLEQTVLTLSDEKLSMMRTHQV